MLFISLVLNSDHSFKGKCNLESISLDDVVDKDDVAWLHDIISDFHKKTKSQVAETLLADWPACTSQFVKVFPNEYRRAMQEVALEAEAAKKLEEQLADQLDNEFDEDSVYVEELKTPRDPVSVMWS